MLACEERRAVENRTLAPLQQLARVPPIVLRALKRVAEWIAANRGYRWVGVYEVTATYIGMIACTGATPPAFPRFPVSRGRCSEVNYQRRQCTGRYSLANHLPLHTVRNYRAGLQSRFSPCGTHRRRKRCPKRLRPSRRNLPCRLCRRHRGVVLKSNPREALAPLPRSFRLYRQCLSQPHG